MVKSCLTAGRQAADPLERVERVGFNVPPDRLEVYMDNRQGEAKFDQWSNAGGHQRSNLAVRG